MDLAPLFVWPGQPTFLLVFSLALILNVMSQVTQNLFNDATIRNKVSSVR